MMGFWALSVCANSLSDKNSQERIGSETEAHRRGWYLFFIFPKTFEQTNVRLTSIALFWSLNGPSDLPESRVFFCDCTLLVHFTDEYCYCIKD